VRNCGSDFFFHFCLLPMFTQTHLLHKQGGDHAPCLGTKMLGECSKVCAASRISSSNGISSSCREPLTLPCRTLKIGPKLPKTSQTQGQTKIRAIPTFAPHTKRKVFRSLFLRSLATNMNTDAESHLAPRSPKKSKKKSRGS